MYTSPGTARVWRVVTLWLTYQTAGSTQYSSWCSPLTLPGGITRSTRVTSRTSRTVSTDSVLFPHTLRRDIHIHGFKFNNCQPDVASSQNYISDFVLSMSKRCLCVYSDSYVYSEHVKAVFVCIPDSYV